MLYICIFSNKYDLNQATSVFSYLFPPLPVKKKKKFNETFASSSLTCSRCYQTFSSSLSLPKS